MIFPYDCVVISHIFVLSLITIFVRVVFFVRLECSEVKQLTALIQ